jgi:hypothetical protein
VDGWRSPQFARPWWLDAPPVACLTLPTPAHDPPQPFDACDYASWGSTDDGDMTCDPPAGALYCGGGVVVAVNCLTSADCPEGMACTQDGYSSIETPLPTYPGAPSNRGYCVIRCNGSTPNECVFCDQTCNPRGLCTTASPTAVVCRSDAECTLWPALVCDAQAGHCVECLKDSDCAAVGGGGCDNATCPCTGGAACCATDADCAAGETCDVRSGLCIDLAGGGAPMDGRSGCSMALAPTDVASARAGALTVLVLLAALALWLRLRAAGAAP